MDEAFNRNKKGKEKEFVKEVEGVGKRNKRGYIYINIYIYIYRERERERGKYRSESFNNLILITQRPWMLSLFE